MQQRNRLLTGGLALVTCWVAATSIWSGSPADAAEGRSVVVGARAQGARATYTMPEYVVVSEFFDGGGPVAESVADSTGRARSFSSLPWPGTNAVTAPGTLSLALGRSVPVAYPFYVQADHPTTPSAELADPTGSYTLSAAAESGKATGQAHLAGAGGSSDSRALTSAVIDEAGAVRVLAESVDTGVSVGDGVLRIASVRSRSQTTLAATESAPVTTAELVIEGATVGGQAVTIDGDGVHAGDQAAPVPLAGGVSSETDLLEQAGIAVEVVPAGVPGGADALVVTSRQRLPVPGNPEGTLVMRFGGAATEIVVGSEDGPVPAPDAEALPAAEETAAPPAPPEQAAASVPVDRPAPAVSPAFPALFAWAPVTAQTPPVAAAAPLPPVASPPLPSAAPRTALPAPLAVGRTVPVPDLATTGALYPILAAGGLTLVAAARAHRWRMRRLQA
jgi:hypothetical protein